MRFLRNLFYPVYAVFRSLLNPRRWLELPRHLGRLSWPALAALSTLVFLSVLLLVVYLRISADKYQVPWLWLRDLTLLLGLIGLISAAVYYAVYLWLLPDYETFDDIELAWEKGLAELDRLGLDLYDLPLFLVLGAQPRDQVRHLMQASGLELAVTDFPAGHSALNWYAGDEGVFLVCSEVGCLTRVAQNAIQRLQQAGPQVSAGQAPAAVDLSRTCWPTQIPEALDGPVEPTAAPPRAPAGPVDLNMTLQVPLESLAESRIESGEDKRRPEVHQQRLALDGDVVNEQLARIEQLCRLITTARQPRAPINGILTVLPLNMILCDVSEGADIKQAAARDLEQMVGCLRLRSPAYAIVNGWEDDVGFRELVRRLPSDKKHNPFGKGNRPGDPPTPDRLEAVAKNATAAFEDWIYHLFKQPDAVSKPGNRQLYTLLCKVRRYLVPRLVNIVADGYASGDREETAGLFGGCYFVAASRDAAGQAFTRGVFRKIIHQHKELEWTARALRSERVYRKSAFVGFAAAVGLLMAAIVMAHRAWFGG
jgi:hypothetical protein